MKKNLPLLVIASVLSFSTIARASTLTVNLGLTGSDLVFSDGGTLAPDQNLIGNPRLTLDHNAVIITPPATVSNFYIRPSGSIYGNSFLSVYGLPDAGQATFTNLPGQNLLGFTWGTIDDYNTLVITDTRNVQYTITGSTVLAFIVGSINHTTQSDVIFNDAYADIKTAVFKSTNNSFEVANLQDPSPNAVPLPPSLSLFAIAILGLVAAAYKRTHSTTYTQGMI